MRLFRCNNGEAVLEMTWFSCNRYLKQQTKFETLQTPRDLNNIILKDERKSLITVQELHTEE